MKELSCFVFFIGWLAGTVLAKGLWLTVTAICVPFYAWYLVVDNGMSYIQKPEPTKTELVAKLSTEDKRNIAIQFMAEYPSWKYTLCNMPMDGRVNKLMCARCEQNAVEQGLPSADELLGHHIHKGKLVAIKTCCAPEERIKEGRI